MGSQHDQRYTQSSALLLWLAWLFGFAGLHRIYLGKPISGAIYLVTWGLFGVGQIIDLVNMSRLVGEANALQLGAGEMHPLSLPFPPNAAHSESGNLAQNPEEKMRSTLLHAAKAHGNTLSVTQGVMATGKSFKDVETSLDNMTKSGYVGIDNDPHTGAVIYTFGDL